jgi:hypothetical protein
VSLQGAAGVDASTAEEPPILDGAFPPTDVVVVSDVDPARDANPAMPGVPLQTRSEPFAGSTFPQPEHAAMTHPMMNGRQAYPIMFLRDMSPLPFRSSTFCDCLACPFANAEYQRDYL